MAGLPLVNLPDGAGSPAQLPVLSIVIPARNEAGNIAALLAALDRELEIWNAVAGTADRISSSAARERFCQ